MLHSGTDWLTLTKLMIQMNQPTNSMVQGLPRQIDNYTGGQTPVFFMKLAGPSLSSRKSPLDPILNQMNLIHTFTSTLIPSF
jgi:hypothetical protein